jgi:tRNA modification GTPase
MNVDAFEKMAEPTESVFSILAAPVRSAIATIWIAGPHVAAAIDQHFVSLRNQSARDLNIRQICYGHWRSRLANLASESQPASPPPPSAPSVGDQMMDASEGVVLCRIAVDQYELHCHGGVAAQQAIADDLQGCQLRQVDWSFYDRQQHQDTIAAEAASYLRMANTETTAAILLDQFNGALEAEICRCVDLLSSDVAAAQAIVDDLLDRWKLTQHLVNPFQVVLAGRANVGKSSLINRLLGFERTIVFDQPGTTRDVVKSVTAFGGWPVEIADTAGIRSSQEAIEIEGIRRAKQVASAADLVLLVLDASDPNSPDETRLLADFPQAMLVWNKWDIRCQQTDFTSLLAQANRNAFTVSCLTGAGISALITGVAERLIPAELTPGTAAIFTQRQADVLQTVSELLQTTRPDGTQATRLLNQIICDR